MPGASTLEIARPRQGLQARALCRIRQQERHPRGPDRRHVGPHAGAAGAAEFGDRAGFVTALTAYGTPRSPSSPARRWSPSTGSPWPKPSARPSSARILDQRGREPNRRALIALMRPGAGFLGAGDPAVSRSVLLAAVRRSDPAAGARRRQGTRPPRRSSAAPTPRSRRCWPTPGLGRSASVVVIAANSPLSNASVS